MVPNSKGEGWMPKVESRSQEQIASKPHSPVVLPEPNGDFYQVTDSLTDAERARLQQVRAFMEAKVAPVINKYWAEDAFPFDIVPGRGVV
jgi:glutaryl-CoA dehydrogenase